jgi:thiamine biosynthesis protein ThiS
LTRRDFAWYAVRLDRSADPSLLTLHITLNGEPFELDQPVTVADLLAKLEIDPRRVAVEHNLAILKRQRFPEVVIASGDTVEIVNFVGGG